MELSISLPLDIDGFVSRQCPACRGRFKWFDGERDDKPEDVGDPDVYFCPLCGQTAPPDEWFTDEQVAYIRGQVAGPAVDWVARELEDSIEGLNRTGLVEASVHTEVEEPAGTPVEADDMTMVEPPCHPWEPVKIPEEQESPLHCLFCGQRYTC